MSRRLRVGVVVPGWNGPGEDTVLPALGELLWHLARDHDLRLVALRHPPRQAPYTDLGGIPVVPVGSGLRAGPVGRAGVLATGVRALRRIHAEHPLDMLAGFWADEPGSVAVLAARTLGLPAVVAVMGGELAALPNISYGAALGRGGRWATRGALRGADLITVGSSWLFRSVAPHAPDVPLRRLPLGVDTERFAPASAPHGSSRLLFVGSLTHVEDPVLLLRAFVRMGTPGVELVVAGDGPSRDGLEGLADQLGIAARVTFLGHVPRSELPGLYRAADALVVTSRHEAQSMVAVEAAACGLPVVGTAVGVVPELALAGAAIAVTARTPTTLATALDRLLADPSRARMGEAARAYALRTWDLAVATAGWSAAWHDLVDGRAP